MLKYAQCSSQDIGLVWSSADSTKWLVASSAILPSSASPFVAASPLVSAGLTSPFVNGFFSSSAGDFSTFGFLVRVPAEDFLRAAARAAATLLAAAVGAGGAENPDRLVLPTEVLAAGFAVAEEGLVAGNRRVVAGLGASVPAPEDKNQNK